MNIRNMRRRPPMGPVPRIATRAVIPNALREAPEEQVKRLHDRLYGLSGTPSALDIRDVPIDMQKRAVQEYNIPGPGSVPSGLSMDDYLRRITAASEMIAETLVLDRGLLGRAVPILTTPTSLARAEYLRGYIFLNPATSIGLTSSVTVLPSQTVVAAGTSASIGVSNFREGHFFIDVTDTDGGTTTLAVFQQALDPTTNTFFDVQQLVSTAATGSFYSNVGAEGIVTDMRIRFTVTGGSPSATFSVGFVRKDGLPGSTTSGLTRTVFLGSGALSTVNGFPLLEGQRVQFFMKENIELFGIAEETGLEVRVFEL